MTQEPCGGNKNVLDHDCSCGKMTVYICQETQIAVSKPVNFNA